MLGFQKLLTEKSPAFSQMTHLGIQQHSQKNPFPHLVFLLLKTRREKISTSKEQHRRNIHIELFKKLLPLVSLKESDQQLLGMYFLKSRTKNCRKQNYFKKRSVNVSNEHLHYSNSKQLAQFFQFLKSQQHKNVGSLHPQTLTHHLSIVMTMNNH